MSAQGDTIIIDLQGVRSKAQLMDVLGNALELGGPNGNFKVEHPRSGKGWGQNWDALLDSLSYLETGGIWGSSRRFRFPLNLHFRNTSAYRTADQKGFATLMEILETTRKRYAANAREFRYRFEHDA